MFEELPEKFRKRFGTWYRIEPRCREDSLSEGVQAKTADALWFLTRQWMTGEFKGEDAGSPISVDIEYSTQGLDFSDLSGDITGNKPIPLECLVEREQPVLNYRERVRIGQEFERRLKVEFERKKKLIYFENILSILRNDVDVSFPAETIDWENLDNVTASYVHFMTKRVIDGKIILNPLYSFEDKKIPFSSLLNKVKEDITKEWYPSLYSLPTKTQSKTWNNESLDYRFEANNKKQKVYLKAPEYRNGTLDWYTFEGEPSDTTNWEKSSENHSANKTSPTPINIAGTSPRWWSFEDARINFGNLDVAKPDIAKLMLMEMALIYSDDWFAVPLPIPYGNLARIDTLCVRDVFGESFDIKPARHIEKDPLDRFDMFTLSPIDDHFGSGIGIEDQFENKRSLVARPLLLIPPVSNTRMESKPFDEVLFHRDEGANMVWAIERIVSNGIGKPIDGYDAQRERLHRLYAGEYQMLDELNSFITSSLAKPDNKLDDEDRKKSIKLAQIIKARLQDLNPNSLPTPKQNDVSAYRLSTTVPENWIPFIPHSKPGSRYQLRRAKMMRNTDHAMVEHDTLPRSFITQTLIKLKISEDKFDCKRHLNHTLARHHFCG